MAVTSSTDICNLAQDLLSGAIINDVENPVTSTESLYERWYDQSRKKTLREHPWNFAIKRKIIAASSTDPEFGYTKSFPVPNDFIRLLTLETDEGSLLSSENFQFEDGNILMSGDASSVRLRYIYDIEDVSKFNAMYIQYLALDIALSVAYKITESNTNVDRIAQLLKQQGQMTRAISGQERQPTRIQRSRNVDRRRSLSSYNTTRIQF